MNYKFENETDGERETGISLRRNGHGVPVTFVLHAKGGQRMTGSIELSRDELIALSVFVRMTLGEK